MIKHVMIWKICEELSEEEKNKVKREAKTALEALSGSIEGLADIRVNIDMLPSSNGDMMLDSSFESEAALAAYQKHPLHVAAADSCVRPFSMMRLCCDFEI